MREVIKRVALARLRVPVWAIAASALIIATASGARLYALTRTFELHVNLPDAYDLRQGTPVTCDGLLVGHIRSIGFAKANTGSNPATRVDVELRIDRRYRQMVPKDSSATLAYRSLLGGPEIAITRGNSNQSVSAGGEIAGVPPAMLPLDPAVATTARACFQKLMKEIESSGTSVK